MLTKQWFIYLFSFLVHATGFSQDIEKEDSEKKHSISLILGHTQIVEGVDENGKREWLSVPSWGLDYNFEVTEKWAIGLHSDIVLEEFIVEHSNDERLIERSFPIAAAFVISYTILDGFNLLSGIGGEFAKEDHFLMARLGFEYIIPISNDWEVVTNLINDLKLNAYNSFTISVGIGKRF